MMTPSLVWHLYRRCAVVAWLVFFAGASCARVDAYQQEVRSESEAIAAKLAADGGARTIAVVDFTDLQGNVTELGRFMAEEFSVALADTGRGLKVVDRTHLRSLLLEHELSSTGLIDPQTARELGKIAGVEALVTGSITPFGDSIRVAVKVLDTDTAQIVMSSAANVGKTPAIEELLRREVQVARGTTHHGQGSGPRSIDVLIAGQFRYELLSCLHQGDSVGCTLRVTNLTEDRNFGITSNDSRIIAEDGFEYWASGVAVGQERGEWFVNRTLPQDVPVLTFVWFGRVSQAPRRIAVMEINANGGKIQFRDVALER